MKKNFTPYTKRYFKGILMIVAITMGLRSFVANAQSSCNISAISFIDKEYETECEGSGAVLTAILFGGQSGTVAWYRIGQQMPSSAYSTGNQLYVNPYFNSDQGEYMAIFTSDTTGCTDTTWINIDSLAPQVLPQIQWVQDLCGAVQMKAVNINDTIASNYTYDWSDENGDFSIHSQYISTNLNTEAVQITSITYGCSNTTWDYMPVSQLQPPAYPYTITVSGGPAQVCAGYTRTYTAAAESGVNYNWTVPVGAVINYGQGTRSISVTYDVNFAGGQLTLTKSNASCSISRSLAILKAKAPVPGGISGITKGLCGATGSYTVGNVNGITYTWTVPAGAVITNGQGTNTITVNFSSSNFTGTIAVTATNNCGTGTPRSLTVKAAPETPSVMNGASIVCSGSTGNYTISAVSSATSYTWTAPAGSYIKANGVFSNANVLTTTSTAVEVKFGLVSATSLLKVKANNGCASGSTRTKALSPCVLRSAEQENTKQNLWVYPNPTNEQITINFNVSKEQNAHLIIVDITGKTCMEKEIMAASGLNEHAVDLNKLEAGIYVLKLITSEKNQALQFVKE